MSSLNKINKFKTVSLPINFALPGASNDFPILGRSSFDYTWIFVLGAILAFTAAWGIGANDVANSFATSVGSRTLKMWQAVLIAGLCEFLGAYLLGARVTATIRSGITDVNAFVGHDDLLMFGMFCTLAAMTFWLALATFLELPVSTTHTVIGAIIGFSLCSPSGGNAVQWNQVGLIVAGWIVAPLLCGAASALLFFSVRRFILRSDNALDRAFYAFPVLVFMTITINVIFIMTKGGIGKGQGLSSGTKISDGVSVGISFAVGAVFMIFVALVVNPPLKRYINSLSDKELVTIAKGAGNIVVADGLDSEENGEKTAKVADDAETGNSGSDDILSANNSLSRPVGPIEAFFDRIFHQDRVHAHIKENATVGGIHDNAEIFPIKIEYAFGYLQVFTAMFAAFAHGANDVANAIGPFAAINSIHESGVGAVKNASVPDWILVLGGAGIVAGLAMYGHIIIAAMGVKMVKITPARGFCIELCVAFVIIIGSYIGIPLSSTQTAIGGIIGVGLVETSVKKAVNWKLLVKVFLGWIATLIVAALSCALLFSFGTFSPSQNYPLNARNCLKQYGTIKNVTKGDASSYNVSTVDGLITGLIGFPSTGVTIPLA